MTAHQNRNTFYCVSQRKHQAHGKNISFLKKNFSHLLWQLTIWQSLGWELGRDNEAHIGRSLGGNHEWEERGNQKTDNYESKETTVNPPWLQIKQNIYWEVTLLNFCYWWKNNQSQRHNSVIALLLSSLPYCSFRPTVRSLNQLHWV